MQASALPVTPAAKHHPRVVLDFNAHVAIEVMRSPEDAVLAMMGEGGSIVLVSQPLKWSERLEYGVVERHFDREYRPLLKLNEPYPVTEAARKFMRGSLTPPVEFRNGALEALIGLLPAGDLQVYESSVGLIGKFASREDAELVLKASGIKRAVMFSSLADFKKLTTGDREEVLLALDPEREWPAKFSDNHYRDAYAMAKEKKRSTTAKPIAKAAAKNKRADGPVAKARALFEKMKDKTTTEIIAAAVAAGVNKGTANTQLGRWRKENGIVVPRGGPRKKEGAAAGTGAQAGKKKKDKTPAKPGKKKAPAKPAKAPKKKTPKPATPAPAAPDPVVPEQTDDQQQTDTADAQAAVGDAAKTGAE